jgi:hypothetical protein
VALEDSGLLAAIIMPGLLSGWIILAYFWKSRLHRPFKYAEAIFG